LHDRLTDDGAGSARPAGTATMSLYPHVAVATARYRSGRIKLFKK
jgi:hypothetical protein